MKCLCQSPTLSLHISSAAFFFLSHPQSNHRDQTWAMNPAGLKAQLAEEGPRCRLQVQPQLHFAVFSPEVKSGKQVPWGVKCRVAALGQAPINIHPDSVRSHTQTRVRPSERLEKSSLLCGDRGFLSLGTQSQSLFPLSRVQTGTSLLARSFGGEQA